MKKLICVILLFMASCASTTGDYSVRLLTIDYINGDPVVAERVYDFALTLEDLSGDHQLRMDTVRIEINKLIDWDEMSPVQVVLIQDFLSYLELRSVQYDIPVYASIQGLAELLKNTAQLYRKPIGTAES